MNELNKKKLENLTEVSYDLLDTGLHNKSEHHEKLITNALADGIYKMGPPLYTGLISKSAQEHLVTRKLKRWQLCKEHPKSRRESAVDIINTFEYCKENKVPEIKIKEAIHGLLVEGCQINWVLQEENRKLVPFQSQGLPPKICYEAAGIELVEDFKMSGIVPQPYRYKIDGKKYRTRAEIARDLNISITTVQRRIKRGLIAVERIDA